MNKRNRKNVGVKVGITGLGLGLIVLHVSEPALKVDAITVSLFLIAILPWFYSYIESAKLPGGFEIKFRDIKEAGEKISRSLKPQSIAAEELQLSEVKTENTLQLRDPNLALVDLRIKIERSLRTLAKIHGLNESKLPLQRLLGELIKQGVIPDETAKALKDLIRAGNGAAHGAKVDPQVTKWARDRGPEIVQAVENLAS